MQLTDEFEVSATPNTVWDLIWDLKRVALCLPGCQEVEAGEDGNYKARMLQKIGPFTIRPIRHSLSPYSTAKIKPIDER